MTETDEARPTGLRVGGLTIPLAEVVVRASRSSGPGGQHANVTASRVEASFDVRASRTLSEGQRERAADARRAARRGDLAGWTLAGAQPRAGSDRLSERLARALATPKRRRATRPTVASRERRLQAKRRGAERKRERRPPEDA